MIQRENDYLARGSSFAIETTLAGKRVLRLMNRARQAGYSISLIYIGVDRVETVLGRIEERVSRGGHDVPEVDVRRRYERSLRHLRQAAERSNRAQLIDNSRDQDPFDVLLWEEGRLIQRCPQIPQWASEALRDLLG